MKVDRRAYTALVTPFLENEGDIDFRALENLLSIQIENKLGLVVLGTTGETPTLSDKEKRKIIKLGVKKAKDKVPIIVGTGSYSTRHTIEETIIAQELGADAALIVTPYYNKPTDEGVYRHFESIVNSTNIPIVVYNIKGRTAKNISTLLLKRISGLDKIIGVKEASGDMDQIMEVRQMLPEEFLLFSGDDGLTLDIMKKARGDGVISVVSNLYPIEISRLVNYGLLGKFERAKELHDKLLEFTAKAFIETNPIPVKYAMHIKGLIKEAYRLPMCELRKENKELVKKTLL